MFLVRYSKVDATRALSAIAIYYHCYLAPRGTVQLQKADYKDVPQHLAAKMLQLKIFYETGEYDLLESHLQALRAFLRRKKDMGYHREHYLNTVHFTQKLLETNPLDKAARAVLRREIEGAKAVAEKEWLLGQV